MELLIGNVDKNDDKKVTKYTFISKKNVINLVQSMITVIIFILLANINWNWVGFA